MGKEIKQVQDKNEKLRGGKCQTRSCLVPACLAVMDGLRWEGNPRFTLAISTIYRADGEKKQNREQLNSHCSCNQTKEDIATTTFN